MRCSKPFDRDSKLPTRDTVDPISSCRESCREYRRVARSNDLLPRGGEGPCSASSKVEFSRRVTGVWAFSAGLIHPVPETRLLPRLQALSLLSRAHRRLLTPDGSVAREASSSVFPAAATLTIGRLRAADPEDDPDSREQASISSVFCVSGMSALCTRQANLGCRYIERCERDIKYRM